MELDNWIFDIKESRKQRKLVRKANKPPKPLLIELYGEPTPSCNYVPKKRLRFRYSGGWKDREVKQREKQEKKKLKKKLSIQCDHHKIMMNKIAKWSQKFKGKI